MSAKQKSLTLSGPQRRILESLAEHGDWRFAGLFNTNSLIVLVTRGLVEAPYGLWHAKIRITAKGREALSDGLRL